MIIVFSGIDGSGKTTYADRVLSYLKSQKINFKYHHIVKDSFYNFILHNVIGRISSSSQRSIEQGLRKPEKKLKHLILRSIKKILLLTNLLCFNIMFWRCRSSIKRNIICDRYFFDDIVQLEYLNLASRSFISFYKNLIIEPDIIFYFKIDPTVAFKRKMEYEIGYYLEKCKIYDDWAKRLPNVTEISENAIEENTKIIQERLRRLIK
ncbi:MAG: hypothetical protein HY761_08570 [Candidatus Omnitrophica bacterium]|nr:hypothetical protein [Candidatus Omnitrophota bacterium]